METKNCQNCKKNFKIEQEDFNFYEKIKVPPPTWCPECRMARRLSFNNTWSLFWRICDKCGTKTLSEYTPENNIKVYCQKCWWGDSWDGTEFGKDYDPSKPFFEQLKELSLSTPYVALESSYLTLKNSEYSNSIAWSKNCYLVFWADYCENVYYSSILNGLKWSADCIRGFNSELCYGSVGFSRNYRVFFSDECNDCVDVWFSRNCYGCSDCVGSVNLRGAKNCIFNVQYSKEEYKQKIQEMNLSSWTSLQNLFKKAQDFWLSQPYREYNGNNLNLNVTGEHIYSSKNSQECFIVNGLENCKWTQLITVPPAKDCMDYSGWGNNAELIYESVNVGENASHVKFSALCFPDALNLEYCIWNVSGKNNFGCVNLKRKKYCILNKEYPKEDFEKLREQIIEDMKKNPYLDRLGREIYYGNFFPLDFSFFSYNRSNGMKFVPKSKEEALTEGYTWNDTENQSAACTIKSETLPPTIKETVDSILEEIIECSSCKRGYKIVQGELELLRKMGLPVPHECPKCRENKRFDRENKPGMHHRKCAKCNEAIYTPYAPDDPRIVYCVKDYQAQFA